MQLKLHMVTIEDLVPEGHFLRKLEDTLDLPICTTAGMAARQLTLLCW